MKYTIYQVKRGMTREFGWMGLGDREQVLGTRRIDMNLYVPVYSGEIDVKDEAPVGIVLGGLYEMFNMDHPVGYEGHSVSISDIILLEDRYWYCDSPGWTDVTDRLDHAGDGSVERA